MMLLCLQNLSAGIVGFKATGDITEKDITEKIIPKVEDIRSFTNFFSYLTTSDYKGFEHADLKKAIDWVAEKK